MWWQPSFKKSASSREDTRTRSLYAHTQSVMHTYTHTHELSLSEQMRGWFLARRIRCKTLMGFGALAVRVSLRDSSLWFALLLFCGILSLERFSYGSLKYNKVLLKKCTLMSILGYSFISDRLTAFQWVFSFWESLCAPDSPWERKKESYFRFVSHPKLFSMPVALFVRCESPATWD